MKKILIAGLYCFMAGVSAYGQEGELETKEVVMYQTSHPMTIRLNDQTVLCSNADYGALYLKVLIPDLKNITLFNHRNIGAGAPCVAAGLCGGELNPNGPLPRDVINASRPEENIVVQVTLKRISILNHRDKVCTVYLSEEILAPIRGINFVHQRGGDLGDRAYEDCL